MRLAHADLVRPNLEPEKPDDDFLEFVAGFGILDLGELTEDQTLAFVAARRASRLMTLLSIPQGKTVGVNAHLGYDFHRPKTTIGPALAAYLERTPSAELDLDTLRDPEDIPYASPEDLLLRRRAPKEFLRRLTEGELMRHAWLNPEILPDEDEVEAPESTATEESATEEELVPFFGYLLLDGSESMGSAKDQRNAIGRGLALAFLRSQRELGHPTVLFIFRADLSGPFGGLEEADYFRAVATVLGHAHEGMTNLQETMGDLARAMAMRADRVDIALITDGLSRLTENPLGDAHLHTFLLGERPEELDRFATEQYQKSLHTLADWSDSFIRLGTDVGELALTPLESDLPSLGPVIQSIPGELRELVTAEGVSRRRRRLDNVAVLVKRAQAAGFDVGDLPVWIAEAERAFRGRSSRELAAENQIGLSDRDIRQGASLELRTLASMLDGAELGITTRRDPISETISLWEAIRRLLAALHLTRRRSV